MRDDARLVALGLALALSAGCDTSSSGLPPITDASDITSSGDVTVPIGSNDGPAFVGNVTLAAKSDEVLYADVAVIVGDLVITAQDAAGIRLDALEEVTGAITIVGTAAQEASGNLTLTKLTRVGGNLSATYTHSVGTFELPNLRTIGGHLDLSHGIFEIRAGRLESINGDLRVRDARLVGVQLSSLGTLGGSLRGNRFSAAVDGGSLDLELASLRTVGGDIELTAGPPTYLKARRLAWLAGDLDFADTAVGIELPSLASVSGDVRLERLDAFVFALDSLADVGGDFLISASGGAGLESVSLPSLATVAGRVVLTELSDTAELHLDTLHDVGRVFRVEDNPKLSSFSAQALPTLHSDLSISENGLALLIDLPSLTTIGGDLRLDENGGIDARLGLLDTVTGDVRVTTTRVTRLALPALATVGRDLIARDLASSEGVLAFPSLATVGGDLQVIRTAYVTTVLAPLLTTVGQTLDGFPRGDLRLEQNQHLANLDFSTLEHVVGAIAVFGNSALSDEVVEDALAEVSQGGTRTVCDNLEATACE